DDQNDPAIGEPVLTPLAYQTRLNKASMAIRDYLHAPDIVALQEIENLTVLQAIAARISEDAIANGQTDPQYVAYLEEGNDVGGIDVGFLVRTDDIGAGLTRDRKSTRLNSSHVKISYAVFCLKKKTI